MHLDDSSESSRRGRNVSDARERPSFAPILLEVRNGGVISDQGTEAPGLEIGTGVSRVWKDKEGHRAGRIPGQKHFYFFRRFCPFS